MYFPKKSLKVGEKIELTKEHEFSNAHQRDALAAALNAFAHYENKIRKIDSRDLGVEAKKRVFSGKKITQERRKDPKPKPSKKPKKPSQETVSGLLNKINSLETLFEAKTRENKKLLENLAKTESKLKMAYDKRACERNTNLSIKTLKSRTRELEGELDEFRKLSSIVDRIGSRELKPVGVYPKIFDGITVLNQKIKGTDLEDLRKAKFVFTSIESNKSVLKKLRIVFLDPKLLVEVCGHYFSKTTDLVASAFEEPVSLKEIVSQYRGSK